MNCDRFHHRLEAAILARQPLVDLDEGVLAHATTCAQPTCQSLWDEARGLSDLIPVWQAGVPRASLVQQVVSTLRDASQAGETFPRIQRLPLVSPVHAHNAQQVLAVVTAAAASCLLAASLWLTGFAGSTTVARSLQREGRSTLATPSSAGVVARPSATDQKKSLVAMAQSATEMMTDTVVLVIPAGLAMSDEEDEPRHTSAWVNAWGRRLEPLGRELSTAVEAVLEAVPKSPRKST